MRRISLLAFGLILLRLTPVSYAQWTAFNDHVPNASASITHTNTTRLKIPVAPGPTTTNVLLKNIVNGTNLNVTLTITRSTVGLGYNLNGAQPSVGTPLRTTFDTFVDFGANTDCNVELFNSGGTTGTVTYAFTGLNPAKRYSFIGGAVRNSPSQTNRWTRIELQSADALTSAHTAGTLTLASNVAAANFGFNTTNGNMVDWESINPGADGTFSVVCTHFFSAGSTNNGTNGYAITGIRLEELVVGPPVIITPPASQTVFAGETYNFRVTAVGSQPLSYQWYKNNSPVGSNATNYSATAAFPGDNGAQFYVVVANSFGSVTSTPNAILTVTNSRPFIISQPQDVTVSAPQTATFIVNANGSKPLSYQWYRNGSMIAGATGTNYTTAATSIADSGSKFYVMIFNGIGSTNSREATLTVNVQPLLILPFTNMWRYNQNGTDLGTAWRAVDYVDSGWSQGRGFLALESAAAVTPYINTTLALNNGMGEFVRTFYFRSHFNLPADPNSLVLVSSNMIDDGAVFYVNGQEVRRQGMAAAPAPILYSDFATAGPGTEGEFTTNVIPADVLVEGDNVIAVEVHQINGTSSDIVFGNGLTALFLPPTALAITSSPGDRTVTESASTTFAVTFSGTQPTFQWYKWVNELPVAIAGATKRLYTITNTTLADSGYYFVVVSNALGAVSSAPALLTVITDLAGPTLLLADGSRAPTNVLVSFSEFVLASTATNIANYKITNATSGGTLAISSAVLINGTNVSLTSAARSANVNYLLIVNNVRDISSSSNAIAPNSTIPISSAVTLIGLEQFGWNWYNPVLGPPNEPYYPGDGWNLIGFQESQAWGMDGAGLFVYDLSNEDLPGARNTLLSQGATTSYFRYRFNFNGSPLGAVLRLRHVVDDGAIFYLNGTEFYRFNMPAGAVNEQTPANVTVGVATFSEYIELPTTLLKAGSNIFAAELHGLSQTDQDYVFGAELTAQIASYMTGAVMITSGPSDVTVQEGSLVTFSITGIAATSFQWRTNGTAIPGATNSVYTIAAVPSSWNGKLFSVVASNPGGSVTSTNARLTVVSDTIPPTLLSAYGTAPTSITASFSEPVSAVTATNTANYRVTNSAGANLTISGASLAANGTNVTLTVSAMTTSPYTLIVNNVRDTSTSSNRIASNSIATVGYVLSIPIDATWRFFTNNTDLGTGWRATAYNDTAAPWTNGPALIADETATLPEPIKTAISRRDNDVYHYTFYFRYHVLSPYAINNLPITFRHIIDDGALMYINGQQFYSFNMSNDAASVTYTTQASVNVGDGAYNGPISTNINLVAGDNVIAVEVHQNGTDSSDVTFGATFSAQVPSVATSTATAPPLQITKSGTNVVVTWPGTGYTLEKKNVLSPATFWVPLTNQAPWTYAPASSTNPATFYRLHR